MQGEEDEAKVQNFLGNKFVYVISELSKELPVVAHFWNFKKGCQLCTFLEFNFP